MNLSTSGTSGRLAANALFATAAIAALSAADAADTKIFVKIPPIAVLHESFSAINNTVLTATGYSRAKNAKEASTLFSSGVQEGLPQAAAKKMHDDKSSIVTIKAAGGKALNLAHYDNFGTVNDGQSVVFKRVPKPSGNPAHDKKHGRPVNIDSVNLGDAIVFAGLNDGFNSEVVELDSQTLVTGGAATYALVLATVNDERRSDGFGQGMVSDDAAEIIAHLGAEGKQQLRGLLLH